LPGGDGHPVAHAALLPTPLGSTSALGVIAAAGILAVAVGLAAARKPRAIPVDPWNCGAPPPSPRQTYTPQGLVMPYRILFAEILRPGSDLRLQDAPIAPLAPHKGRYVDPEPSFIEPWLHQPLLAFLTPKLEALRRVHRGPVQAYLLVALLVLVAILLLLPVVL
jgi:hypothetical protein